MPDLQELKEELIKLLDRRKILAKAVDRARVRTSGRLTPRTNKTFAAGQAEELATLDKLIADKRAQIIEAGG